MYSARCPNPACAHAFTSDRSGSVHCPVCGTVALVVLDVGATVDPTPPAPRPRADLPGTVDTAATQRRPDLASTIDPAPVAPPSAGSTLDHDAEGDTASLPAQKFPATIGRFRIRSRLGAGAFGEVFRAHDPQLDREVALKVAKPGTLDTPDRVGRFLREARAAANLRHPNIVPVFDSGRDGDRHYIASGFIDGRTLEAEIEEADTQLPDLKRAAAVVRKLADALGYAHRQGVVHRDVKPANVLVDQAGEPSLTDFGLAMRAGDEAVQTQAGKVMGTPAYMSPEQAAGRSAEASAASDQYALGIMLYEMCTGRRPFDGLMELVIYQQVGVEPRRPRTENRLIPKDLETVILKCLEKNPKKRYASCEALAEDLRRFLAGEPVTARRIGPAERFGRWCQRNPAVASSVSFGVLALLIGLVVALAQADVAKQEAKRANEAAFNEARQKQLADEKADLATKEAKRATKAEEEVTKKASDLGVALRDKTKAEEDASRRSMALAAETKKLTVALDEANNNLSNSKMLQAWTAWERGEAAQTRELLRQVSEGYRRWEWGYLLRQTEGSLFTLYGHTLAVSSASFSNDGRYLLTASADGTARVWDARTGGRIAERLDHRCSVNVAAFSPDGERVVTAGDDGTARIWDARTGKSVTTFTGQTSKVTGVLFSPDGARVVTAGDDGTARIWDARTGKPIATLTGHERPVCMSSFSPDGARVTTASWDQTARVWDARTGNPIATLAGHTGQVYTSSFSPDGSRVVTAGCDGTARVWDARTGTPGATLTGHEGPVYMSSFSPDGERVATAGDDRTARVWDAHTGKQAAALIGHTDKVVAVSFSPDGEQVATASWDQTARVWDSRNRGTVVKFGDRSAKWRASFSSDGTRVMAPSDVGARVWDTRSGAVIAELEHTVGGTKHVVEMAILSRDGGRAVTSGGGGSRVWDARTGAVLATLQRSTSEPQSASFSADGSHIVTVDFDGTARVWDAQTGKTVATFRGPPPSRRPGEDGTAQASFSPDGLLVVAVCDDGTARVWDVRTRKQIITLTGDTNQRVRVKRAWFSPDGTRVVTTSDDKMARVWDIRTGKPVATLTGHTGRLFVASFSPDGNLVVTFGSQIEMLRNGSRARRRSPEDRVAWVFDIRTGAVLSTLQGHTDYVHSASFSPDGARVLTASADGTARVWDVRTGTSLAELKGQTSVELAAFSSDGGRVLTSSADGTARVWDGTGSRESVLAGHTDIVSGASYSPDGSRVVSASRDSTVRLWDARAKREIGRLPGSRWPLAFSPDSSLVVTAGDDGTARVWDARTGGAIATVKRNTAELLSAEFSPDSKRVVTTSNDQTVSVWDARTGTVRAEFKDGSPLLPPQLMPKLGGKEVGDEDLGGTSLSAAFSPDGKRVVTTSGVGTARVWDAQTGENLGPAVTGEDLGTAAALPGPDFSFSPDGKFFLSTNEPAIIRIIPVACDKEEIAHRRYLTRPRPELHAEEVQRLAKIRPFAAAVHRSLEQRARGVLAFEAGDLDRAVAHFIVAAALKPQPPKSLDVAPLPHPVER